MLTSRKFNVIAAAAISAIVGARTSTSLAADRYWVGADGGAWNVGGNWSPSGAPAANEAAFVLNGTNEYRTAFLSGIATPVLPWLQVDTYNGSTGGMNLSMSSGTLTTQGEGIGMDHNGSFVQNGGWHNAASNPTWNYYIGYGQGSFGSYMLQNGTLQTGKLQVGIGGQGYFNQDNGTHRANEIQLGTSINGVGAYTMQGGTLTFDRMTVGAGSGGIGRMYLNGGTMSGTHLTIGAAGMGSFNMNGGTLNVSQDMIVGHGNFNTPGATITWNLAKGSATVGSLTIGNTSPGWVDQFSGSTLAVSGPMVVGRNAPGFFRMNPTTYEQANGEQLRVSGPMTVGSTNGTGAMVVDGGYVLCDSGLQVAGSINSRGSYTQNGAFSVSRFKGIGIGAATGAVGTLTVNGGLVESQNFILAIGNQSSLRISNTGNVSADRGIINNGSITMPSGYLSFGDLTTTNNAGVLSIGYGQVRGNRLEQYAVEIGNNAAQVGGFVRLFESAPNASGEQRRNVIGSLSIWMNEANAYKGYLDLSNDDLILTSTSYSLATAYLRAGYNDGEWNGNGIRSSAAGSSAPARTLGVLRGYEYVNNTGANTFDGRSVSAEDVLIKYTYFGDVDFNGSVDVSDYNLIDFGFANHLNGWANGDVDFSAAVDVGDYNLIDFAFSTQSHTLNRAIAYLDGSDRNAATMTDASLQQVAAHFAQFGETYASGFLAHVPEPSTAAIALTAIAGTFASRGRRRRADATRA